jgi:hypothetical protein
MSLRERLTREVNWRGRQAETDVAYVDDDDAEPRDGDGDAA